MKLPPPNILLFESAMAATGLFLLLARILKPQESCQSVSMAHSRTVSSVDISKLWKRSESLRMPIKAFRIHDQRPCHNTTQDMGDVLHAIHCKYRNTERTYSPCQQLGNPCHRCLTDRRDRIMPSGAKLFNLSIEKLKGCISAIYLVLAHPPCNELRILRTEVPVSVFCAYRIIGHYSTL